MSNVSIRDLRNRGGDVIDRVERGEQLTITRDGRPVATLLPVRSRGLSAAVLLQRWSTLKSIDVRAFRRDLDGIVDQRL